MGTKNITKNNARPTKRNKLLPHTRVLSDLPALLMCYVWSFVPREFLACRPARNFYIPTPSLELEDAIFQFVLRLARVLDSPKAQELLQTPLPPTSYLPRNPKDQFQELMLRLATRMSCAISLHLPCSGLPRLLETVTDNIAPLLGFVISRHETLGPWTLSIPKLNNRSHKILAHSIRACHRGSEPLTLSFVPQALSVQQVEWWTRAANWSLLLLASCQLTTAHINAIHFNAVTTLEISDNPDITDDAVNRLLWWVQKGPSEKALYAQNLKLSVRATEYLICMCARKCRLELWGRLGVVF